MSTTTMLINNVYSQFYLCLSSKITTIVELYVYTYIGLRGAVVGMLSYEPVELDSEPCLDSQGTAHPVVHPPFWAG